MLQLLHIFLIIYSSNLWLIFIFIISIDIFQIKDQRRLGAIIVPNKEEVLIVAKKLSIVDADASELSKEKISSLLYEEVRKW